MGRDGLLRRLGKGITQIREEWRSRRECQLETWREEGVERQLGKSDQISDRASSGEFSENNEEQERRGGVRDWKGRVGVGLTPGESVGRDWECKLQDN